MFRETFLGARTPDFDLRRDSNPLFTVCSTVTECETTDRDANTLTYIAIPEPMSRSKSVKPIGATRETLAIQVIFSPFEKKASGDDS